MAQLQAMCGQQGRPAELEPRMLMLCPDYMIVQGCASWAWSGDWRLSRRAQARRARAWRNAKKMRRPGRRRRRRQKNAKTNANKNANKMQQMQTKCEENLGMQKTCTPPQKKTATKTQKTKKNMQKQKMQKHAKKNTHTHSVFAVFPIFQDQPRMRPAPTHLGCIIFAFCCILVAFFCIIFAFVLPPSSPSPLAFAFLLHFSMRVPLAPGPFWKAPSLQTNPMIHDPQLGGRNSVCG